jgi:hypothetical protein
VDAHRDTQKGEGMRKTLIACIVTALCVGAGTATAASLITGKDVKNGSLTGADIKDGSVAGKDIKGGSVALGDLTPGVRALIAKAGTPGKDGTNGSNGSNGAAGAKGDKGDKGDTGPQGPAIPEDFSFTNASVELTQAGAKFGPYGDGGAAGGSVRYDGLNGMKLSQITKLIYTAKYATDDDTDVAVPYLRVFLNEDLDDVIFSPNTQASKQTAENVSHTWDVLAGSVRYDDDTGDDPESSWDSVVSDHGDDVISGIYVTAGFTAGKNLRAFLSEMRVNDKTFHFGS